MLTKAAGRGLDDVVQLLLDAGADIEATNEVANVWIGRRGHCTSLRSAAKAPIFIFRTRVVV